LFQVQIYFKECYVVNLGTWHLTKVQQERALIIWA
jgi:hypothetical protein